MVSNEASSLIIEAVWVLVGGGRYRAVQSPQHDIFRAHVMLPWHLRCGSIGSR